MLVAAALLLVIAQAQPSVPAGKPLSREEQRVVDEELARKAAEEAAAQRAAVDAEAAMAVAADRAVAEAKAAEMASLSAHGLDARMRALAGIVALPLKRLPGDHREQQFAVVPFDDVGDEVKQRQLGLVVTDMMVTSLARDHRLPLVERAALSKIMNEQVLQQSGAIADDQVVKVGKIAGARSLIVGQVSDAGDAFRVSVRALDIESGAVIEGTARDVMLPKEELLAFSARSVVLRSKSGAMFRSVVVPGWGQAYNEQPVKGGVVGVTAGGLALATLSTAAVGGYLRYAVYPQVGFREEDKTLSPEQIPALAKSTREAGDNTLVASGVLAALCATAWGFGVVDAYLSGTDVESLDAALQRN